MKNLEIDIAPRFKPWQRFTSLITLFFFLFQITGTAVASTLSAIDIQTEFDNAVEFKRASSNSSFQYVAASEFLENAPLVLPTIAHFYQKLRSDYPQALGEQKFIPIAVGDITTFIPTYDNPKHVGSSFVQTRYVRNQVHELLGRHLIDSGLDEFRTETMQLVSLYNNAFSYAVNSGVKFGEKLSTSRVESDVNMIWPELHEINGEMVVVPIVYLKAQTVIERKVDEHVVEFNGAVTFGSIHVAGVDISGRAEFLQAVDDLTINSGEVSSENEEGLKLIAGGTLTLLSSLVRAEGDLVIGAHNVQAQTLVHRYDLGHEQGTRFGEVTNITSGGDVTVRSYSDIVLQGVDVNAAGGISFGSEGNIYLGAIADSSSEDITGAWSGQKSSVDYLQTHLTAEESISLMAGGQIVIDAAEIVSSSGHIEILAGMGITIEDELGQYSKTAYGRFGKKKVDESVYQTVAIRSILDAGKGVKLHSDFGDITLKAVDLTSRDGTQVKASNGAVNLLMTTETDHYSYSSVKKGLFTTKTVNRGHNIETGVNNTIVGGFAVEALNGVNIEYEGLKGLDCTDYLDEVGVIVPSNEDSCLRANILKVSDMPGMEWMGEVLAMADADPEGFNWDEIALKHKTWSVSNTSLSPAFMAVISIAVAVATAGAGSAVAGFFITGAEAALAAGTAGFMATAISAGTVALISQASVALANGAVNGDIGGAMEDFASEDTLKSLAVSMVTAGAIAELDAAFFDIDTVQTEAVNDLLAQGPATPAMIDAAKEAATHSLGTQVAQAVTNATVRAGVDFTINGTNADDLMNVFVQSLGQSAVSSIGESLANEIGLAKYNGDIGTATQYISHAAVGCLTGTATAKLSDGETSIGCFSGAGGAVVGEVIGQAYETELEDDLNEWIEGQIASDIPLTEQDVMAQAMMFKQRGVDMARLGSALSAFVAGGDVYIAADAGANAAENNALFLISVIAVAAYTSYVSYQEGGLYEGLQAIGRGDDPLSQALGDATDAAVELAVDTFPESSAQVSNVLDAVGDKVAAGVIVVMETEAGERVEYYWNQIDKADRDALKGAGKVVSLVIPAAVITKLRTLRNLNVDTDIPLDKWVNDPNHPNWEQVSSTDRKIIETPNGFNNVKQESGGTLIFHENIDGHTIRKHVGKTDEELTERYLAEPDLKGSSTYPDLRTAESAVGDTLLAKQLEIKNWLEDVDDIGPKSLNHTVEYTVGKVVLPGTNISEPTSKIFVHLRKDPLARNGYRIVTSYPKQIN